MSRLKVDQAKFMEIKQYAKTHSIADTQDKFKVCKAVVSEVKRYGSYDIWREEKAKIQRESYLARKAKIFQRPRGDNGIRFTPPKKPIDGTNRTVNGDPFGDGVAPKPITPLGATKAPEQDGPVTTTKVETTTLPLTYDDYRKAYNEEKSKADSLETVCKMNREEIESLKLERSTLQGKLAKAELDYRNLKAKYDALLRPVKPIGNVVEQPKEISPTEIEITVGDATIKVTTRGETNLNV